MEWICGGTTRKPYISENLIRGWDGFGLEFYQSSNTQVSCNTIDSTTFGVEFTRDSGAVGQAVRFRSNQIDIASDPRAQFVVRSDDANKSVFGPSAVFKGNNKVIARGADNFFVENDPDTLGTINARDNYWLRNGVAYADTASILSYCSTDISDPARISVSGALPTEPQIGCLPSGTQVAREEGTVDSDAAFGRGDASLSWPTRTEIVGIQPNPGRNGTAIEFAAKDPATAVQIQVFDVAGRRVRVVFSGEAPRGVNRVSWDGRDDEGRDVATGVYFVQLRSGETVSTRRFVMLR